MTEDDHKVAIRAIDTLDQFMDLMAAHKELHYRGPQVTGALYNLLDQILIATSSGLPARVIQDQDKEEGES